MQLTPGDFQKWHNPQPEEIGADHIEFLKILGEPSWLTFDGADPNRSRAIVTLLHGNEPSGLKSVHRWIKSAQTPATNLGVFIGSVNAALHPPLLSHRYLPQEKDFNRCFNPPFTCNQGQLAERLLTLLHAFAPEAVVDAHNTSAHSEPFAVASNEHAHIRQIAQLFTRRLVVMHRKLGALIEQGSEICPIVTVEFGGFADPRADTLACESLDDFIQRHKLFNVEPLPFQVLRDPKRLEVLPQHKLHYASSVQESVQESADITVFNTIDQLNFSEVQRDTSLGWLGKDGIRGLVVKDENGNNLLRNYFYEKDGFLMTKVGMHIFMASTDAHIAQNDCLLYLTLNE